MSIRQDKMIMVCDKCLKSSCWYGEFMCDEAQDDSLCVSTTDCPTCDGTGEF